MADIWIFNNSGSDSTYRGQLIAYQAYYQIQESEKTVFANDSALLADIGSAAAIISRNNASADHITDVSLAINYLKNINQTVSTHALKDSTGLNFRGKGITATITAGTTHNIDYKLPENREFDQIGIVLQNHMFGDKADLQFVDKDGVYYPAGTVLATFFYDYYFSASLQGQGLIKVDYTGTLIKDLYLRVKYYSTGVTDVNFCANLFLHKKD